MSMIDRSIDSLTFLTEEFRDTLRRRLRELSGIALIAVAALLALALATWSVKDPSFSHATNAKVTNLLGFPGAAIADLLMQLFGLAAVALVLTVAIWGWRLTAHHTFDRKWLRALAWIGGIVLACCVCLLPATQSELAVADGSRRCHRRRRSASPGACHRSCAQGMDLGCIRDPQRRTRCGPAGFLRRLRQRPAIRSRKWRATPMICRKKIAQRSRLAGWCIGC